MRQLQSQQKARFFQQLASLLDSGLSLQQSLSLAGRDLTSGFQNYLQRATVAVGRGQSLAAAISQPPVYFDGWTLGLLEAAEYSGALSVACRRLAIASERQHRRDRLYNSVKLATIAIIWSLFLLITAIVAGNASVLSQSGFWLLAIGLLVLLIVASNFFGSHLPIQSLQGVPILAKILQARSMLYFAELELPLSCGVSLGTALELWQKHIPDPVMAGKIAIASQRVLAGQSLSKSLQGRLPPIALGMLRTGEETGNLDAALEKIAKYYEGELERLLLQLKSILIPLSIIAIGALVALVGIWGITSLINSLPG
ncbi:type II secretion system F family protein [Microseira sp. BLCC-F43]|jgi:type II secretory pathway component PulF|uniref:type II secretion system F family protein n=1 Tax=Microseira sp. BLCC-F43 TaxID=3153602 RepID=UPI0035BAFD96